MISHRVLLVIVVVFFVALFIRVYWKIQYIVNRDQLGTFTHSKFLRASLTHDKYLRDTSHGRKIMNNSTVVICGLVRNVSMSIGKIIKKVEKLGENFKDYRVLIVENDSKDDTRKKLLKWRDSNPRVVILGCGYNKNECSIDIAAKETTSHECSQNRIEKMAHLRNIYVAEVKKRYNNYDFMIVWDLDIIGTVYTDGVAHSIGFLANDEKRKVVCAYGSRCIGDTCLYYDTYAHQDIDQEPSKAVTTRLENIKLIGDPPVQVFSCFSGFSIYKIGALMNPNVYYDTNQNIDCEHVVFHKKIRENNYTRQGDSATIYMNPSMLHLVLNNDYL